MNDREDDETYERLRALATVHEYTLRRGPGRYALVDEVNDPERATYMQALADVEAFLEDRWDGQTLVGATYDGVDGVWIDDGPENNWIQVPSYFVGYRGPGPGRQSRKKRTA